MLGGDAVYGRHGEKETNSLLQFSDSIVEVEKERGRRLIERRTMRREKIRELMTAIVE